MTLISKIRNHVFYLNIFQPLVGKMIMLYQLFGIFLYPQWPSGFFILCLFFVFFTCDSFQVKAANSIFSTNQITFPKQSSLGDVESFHETWKTS